MTGNSDIPLPTKITMATPPYNGNEQVGPSKANDRNILTFYETRDTNAYIIFDLGKAEYIRKLAYAPRNDDNYIWPGNTYQLFYQNGTKGWCLWETRKTTARELHFDGVPENALLWLHLNKGREERIFIIRDGKQIFL